MDRFKVALLAVAVTLISAQAHASDFDREIETEDHLAQDASVCENAIISDEILPSLDEEDMVDDFRVVMIKVGTTN